MPASLPVCLFLVSGTSAACRVSGGENTQLTDLHAELEAQAKTELARVS